MNLAKYFLLLFILFTQAVFAKDASIYPTCPETNVKYTQRLFDTVLDFKITKEQTEAEFCETCYTEKKSLLLQNQELSQVFQKQLSKIPDICFLASAIRGTSVISKQRSSYCKHPQFKNFSPTGNKKYCINNKYVTSISKAFDDVSNCLQFNKKDKQEYFSLLNHESGMILNARSGKDARCLGQMTTVFVQEINEIIESRHKRSPHKYAYIYNQAIKRCPSLKNKFISEKLSYFTCKATQDPYVCLFYSAMGFKRNVDEISSQLKQVSDKQNFDALSSQIKQRFKLPIRKAQMLTITGVLGKKIRKWTIHNELELTNLLQKLHSKHKFTEQDIISSKLVIQKHNIFSNNEQLKKMTHFWSYNGGDSIARVMIPRIIRDLKLEMTLPCKDTSRQVCKFRKDLLAGTAINTKDMYQFFKKKIKIKYPTKFVENSSKDINRKKEVADFVQKIHRDHNHILNRSSNKKNPTPYLSYFKDNFQHVSKKQKSDFINQVLNVCHRSKLQI